MARLGPTGLVQLVTDIKNWVLGKIPTKVSDLTNDSGFITSNHTHTKSDVTDLFNSANTWNALNTYSNGQIRIKSQSQEIGVTPASSIIQTLEFIDKNNDHHGKVGLWDYDNGASEIQLSISDSYKNGAKDSTGTSDTAFLSFGFQYNGTKFLTFSGQVNNSVIPLTNNTYDLGSSTYQWNKIYSTDVVHTSGNETITGVKTLIDYWHLQAKNLKAGEGETYGRTGYSVIYTDKNDVTMGDVTLFKNANAARTFIRIRGGDYYTNGAPAAAGTLVQSALMVGTNVSGKKIIECDTDIVYPTTNSATDLGDSTHQWKSVHAQTYFYNGTAWGLDKYNIWTSCQKMSCNHTIWDMKNTSITLGTAPSSNRYLGFIWYDSADTDMGRFTVQCHKNGNNYYVMSLKNSDGTTTYDGGLRYSVSKTNARAFYPDVSACDLGLSNGPWANTYTTNLTVSGTGTCTTPATSDNSTNIATTAFVKAQGYLTSHQSLSDYAALASNNRFTSGQIISGNYMGNESSTNARTCITFQSNRDTDGKSGVFFTKFRQNVAQGSMGSADLVRLSLDILENEVRSNDSFMFRWSEFNSDVATAITFCPSSVPTTRRLGTSSNRWTTIYGVDGNFSGTITGSITGTAKGLATSEPMTNETLTYNEGQLTIGSAAGNAYSGSSGTFSLISFPANGTLASNGVANIQNIRLPWATDAKYWHDIFVSPNNNYVWHRDVRKGTGNGWRRLVEENVSGLTNQTWDISIGGTSANVTGTVAIANGGTGATTRLNAVKNLTSEDVGTSTQFFLTITQNWGKAGYCSVANAKSVLGIPVSAIATRTSTAMGTWTVSCTAGALALVVAEFVLTAGGGGIDISSGGIVFSALKVAPTSAIITYSTTGIWQYSDESTKTTVKVRALIASITSSVKFSISGIACSSMSMTVYQ